MWKSWKYLQPGFLDILGLNPNQVPRLSRFSLMRLNVSASFGAACYSAHGLKIPRKYDDIVQVFYSYGVEGPSFKSGNALELENHVVAAQ